MGLSQTRQGKILTRNFGQPAMALRSLPLGRQRKIQ
jgi:hypothetical protein